MLTYDSQALDSETTCTQGDAARGWLQRRRPTEVTCLSLVPLSARVAKRPGEQSICPRRAFLQHPPSPHDTPGAAQPRVTDLAGQSCKTQSLYFKKSLDFIFGDDRIFY